MNLKKGHKYLYRKKGGRTKIIRYHWWRKRVKDELADYLIDLTTFFTNNTFLPYDKVGWGKYEIH